MTTKALARPGMMPSLFEDFFKPWNQWFDDSGLVNRVSNMPAVNISENGNHYTVSLAAPGMNKDDFQIDVEGNILTISSEKEENREEKEDRYTRREYSYTSFSRSFTLPEDAKQENIDARYQDGELRLTIPRREDAKRATATKKIAVQ